MSNGELQTKNEEKAADAPLTVDGDDLSGIVNGDVNGNGSSSGGASTSIGYPFNIGQMPKKLDEASRKRLVAKVCCTIRPSLMLSSLLLFLIHASHSIFLLYVLQQEALTKLLERQQRDVQQTLDLINNLELDTTTTTHIVYEDDGTQPNSSTPQQQQQTAPSIAQSVASGADYGFLSRSEGCRPTPLFSSPDIRFEGYGPPGNVFSLGSQQFMRNLNAMLDEYKDEEDNPDLTPRQRELQAKLNELTLSSDAIWERERARGEVVAPYIIKIPYYVLCFMLDVVFEGRNPFSRFFLLETVARMPYFSYITMLHLYETMGFWRRSSDIKRIHFAEEWNEFHHLLIMESLGGDQPYWVRLMAQHSALAYYLALCMLWMLSPTLSYKFSEMLETHAVDTYGQFVDENEDKLKELPPSIAAVEYYTVGVSDPMFGEYQTASVSDPNRRVRVPGTNLRSLYDVFVAIRNDEGDHVSTMKSCLDPKEATMSPGLENRMLTGVALVASAGYFFGDVTTLERLSGSLSGLSGLQGLEGLSDLADSVPDLDAILSESGSGGAASNFMNGLISGFAGLANGWQEVTGADPEFDEDLTDAASSAVEDIAAGGLDGLEVDGLIEIVKSVVLGILELIGIGL